MIKTYLLFFLSYILTFLLTYFGVGRFRRWSLQRKLFDIPNERSSHTEPTPRGGGLIMAAVCSAVFFAYCLIFQQIENLWSYFAGALFVVFISWLDDLYTISIGWRFLAHSVAAGLVIWSLGFWEITYIPFVGEIFLGKFGIVLTFLWIVWLINAYNFMDGIDGIAGAQAVTAGIGWLFVGIILNTQNTAFYGIVVAVSSLAFLLHNWQPAKIFMGDAGSAFLGYTFAVMPLMALRETSKIEKSLLPLIAVTLVLVFVFDSLWTLAKRTSRFEKIWQAHREHIYQRLVIGGCSHQSVTILYLLISFINGGLLILWLKIRQNSGDFLYLIIFFQLFCLLAYSLKKKTLT